MTSFSTYIPSAVRRLRPAGRTGIPEREYVWLPLDSAGDGGQAWALPIALVTDAVTAGPRLHYPHADHLGTPVAMTSGGLGQLEWSATYRPFGEAHAITGTETLALRLPGQLFDPASGFHQDWHRDYDPRLGRYIQPDPIGLAGGLNTYAYVGGNPINQIDPEGFFAQAIPACLLNASCAAAVLGTTYLLGQKLGELCKGSGDSLDRFLNESTEDRNPAQDKRLSPGEIRALKGAGVDPEELKGGKRTGSQDLYKDQKGNIYVKPKGGKGAGEPTGLNINDYL